MSESEYIRMNPVHLAELQQGHGGPEAIGMLQGGQVSIRKRQLWMLMGIARDTGGDIQQSLTDAFNLLAHNQEAAEAVVAHPTFGAWLGETLWTYEQEPGSFSAQTARLGAFAAAAAIKSGFDFTVKVPVEPDGSVKLPGVGKARLAASASLATVTGKGGRVGVHDDNMTIRPPFDLTVPGDDWQPVRRLSAEAGGVRLDVDLQDAYPDNLFYDTYKADITDTQHRHWQHLFQEAWKMLVTHHPHYARGIAKGLKSIVPLNPTNGQGRSVTAASAFGAAAMTEPLTAEQRACGMVHEFQHSKLYGLLDLLPMHREGASDELFYAPWRDDPRPGKGLLQGVYAHLAIVDFWRRQAKVEEDPIMQFKGNLEFARWHRAEERTLRLLREANNLNSEGMQLVSHVEELLAAWAGEPVPEEARRLAELQADDHEYSWRLHNLRPDSHAIESLTTAFLYKESLPPGEVPVQIIAQNKGNDFAFTGQRSRCALARLLVEDKQALVALAADPARLKQYAPYATPADTQLLLDTAAAHKSFSDRIIANPHDIESWVGLRLACRESTGGLLAQPEVAAAIYRRLASENPARHRPEDILHWRIV